MVRDTIEPTVTYHVGEDTHASYETAREVGEITGVELWYLCPHCETPNAEGHTLPVPSHTVSDCDGCFRRWRLTPTDDFTKQYGAGKIADAAEKLDVKRRVRIAGECYSESTIWPLRLANLLHLFGVLFTIGGAVAVVVLLAVSLLLLLGGGDASPFVNPLLGSGVSLAFGYGSLKLSDEIISKKIGKIPLQNPPSTKQVFQNLSLFIRGTKRDPADSYERIIKESKNQSEMQKDTREKQLEMNR